MVLGISTIMALSMAFNSLAFIDFSQVEVCRENGDVYADYDYEAIRAALKAAYDKYGVSYNPESLEPDVYDKTEATARSEAMQIAKAKAVVDSSKVPNIPQTVTHPDANTTVYDDGYRDWEGATSFYNFRVVTTQTYNGDGTATVNFKIYNTDQKLVDTNKYFIEIGTGMDSIYYPGKGLEVVDGSGCSLVGNDVSVVTPGKLVTYAEICIFDKVSRKQVGITYAPVMVQNLPLVSGEVYKAAFEPYNQKYLEAHKEVFGY